MWWVWPGFMAAFAIVAIIASWVVYPGEGEQLMLLGFPFGAECGFRVATGHPCPQCGMTRSWVYMARGDVLTSLTYSVAGGTLLLWIVVGGIIGTFRLIKRDANAIKPPWAVLAAWILFWVVVPYAGGWTARIMGFNYLPSLLDAAETADLPTPSLPDPSAPRIE
jgi:hypothetical protein